MKAMRMRAWTMMAGIVGAVMAATLSAAAEWRTSAQASVLVCGGSMMNGDLFAASVKPAMREHYAGCAKVALVLHASHPADQDRMEARLRTAFADIGVPAVESLHHRDEKGAIALLREAAGIFVGGGETFVLLRDLARTGQLAVIRERVLAGAPYGGSSAGANVAGLTIGTTNDFPVAEVPSREALQLLPFTINPHHPLPEAKADFDARAGKIAAYLKFNGDETVLALANASILRLHGGEARLVAGTGWVYRTGERRELKLNERMTGELRARE